jgi:hypothetical protein
MKRSIHVKKLYMLRSLDRLQRRLDYRDYTQRMYVASLSSPSERVGAYDPKRPGGYKSRREASSGRDKEQAESFAEVGGFDSLRLAQRG